ncbi:MAG TPA: enoyl-CoA hydratase-related protein [Desulfobacteraceae bacterium]|nr:enoyl-CoA hydratase-related protein [Desulfobacteraceae bacterium]HPJ68260.1 enoyl-CoA hydratase-related protein [Desulfobacteraceae bacterium]
MATITLNRPENFNTFSTEMATELDFSICQLDDDTEVRVVIIQAKGKNFCTGIEVSEFFGKSQTEYRAWVDLMGRISHRIADMRKPVIASARGFAVANGAGIIAASDLAVISESTQIATNAINVGLFCMGPAVPLSRSIGRKRALEMLLTGDMIDAETALSWGIVNRVVLDDQLEKTTIELAKKLAQKSPLALQMGKQAFYGMSDMEYKKALAYSNEMFTRLCDSEDASEGVSAFLEKRTPEWKEKQAC